MPSVGSAWLMRARCRWLEHRYSNLLWVTRQKAKILSKTPGCAWWRGVMPSLGLVFIGLVARSAVDRGLVARGGADTLALWGQFTSLVEIIVGMSAVGHGLSVLVTRTDGSRRARLVQTALVLGALLNGGVGLLLWSVSRAAPSLLAGAGLPQGRVAWGGVAALGLTMGALANAYWVGLRDTRALVGAAAVASVASIAAVLLLPREWLLDGLMLTQSLVALASAAWVLWRLPPARHMGRRAHDDRRELLRYLPAGLANGLLTPASLLVARSLAAQALSWAVVGQLQALWRVANWVGALAEGVLIVMYLPRLSAARHTPNWHGELRAAFMAVVPACALAFVALTIWRTPVFGVLYGARLVPGAITAALFFGGSLLRVVAWVPLFGLYAQARTRAIVVGEVLSLPLFATMLAVDRAHLSLRGIGAAWLLTYVLYAGLNTWLLRRPDHPPKTPSLTL